MKNVIIPTELTNPAYPDIKIRICPSTLLATKSIVIKESSKYSIMMTPEQAEGLADMLSKAAELQKKYINDRSSGELDEDEDE